MFDKKEEMEAENPLTSPQRLDELARNYGKGVKERVAKNPNIAIKTLVFLAQDPMGMWMVVDHPRVPFESLENIAYMNFSSGFQRTFNFLGDANVANMDQQNSIDRLILANRALLNMVRRLKPEKKTEDLKNEDLKEDQKEKLVETQVDNSKSAPVSIIPTPILIQEKTYEPSNSEIKEPAQPHTYIQVRNPSFLDDNANNQPKKANETPKIRKI